MASTLHIKEGDNLSDCLKNASDDCFIHVEAGIYRCKTEIFTRGITIQGEGMDKTVFVFDDYAEKPDSQGRPYVTFRTYTMAVCADNVTMRDLSIVNDARFPEVKGQEVALSVYGDNFTMERCALRSTQDTLFLGPLPPDLIARYDGFLMDALRQDRPLRQRFTDCFIEGTVDFIFGCGDALFENCTLHSLVDARDCGFIAAPAHSRHQQEGFRFRSCRLTCQEGVTPGSVYLARPWRDYGIARFENCQTGPHIHPLGFDKWNDTHRDQTARFHETPPVPGRVSWINKK